MCVYLLLMRGCCQLVFSGLLCIASLSVYPVWLDATPRRSAAAWCSLPASFLQCGLAFSPIVSRSSEDKLHVAEFQPWDQK